MAEPELLLRILQACAQATPAPFFASDFAASSGLDRAAVDAAIDRLRLNGYLHIVDWVQGKGQSYALTPAGIAALDRPTELRQPAVVAEPELPVLRSDTWERGESVRAALLESPPPIVTMTLLFANLAMFAIGLFVGFLRNVPWDEYLFGNVFGGRTAAFGALMDTLGAVSTLRVIADNEWWRLVSYQFLHSGLMHLGMNMLSLYMMGPALESMWGSKRYLYIYLVSGMVGGAVVVVVGRGAVGASGALSGLITSLAIWVWLNRDKLPEQYTSRISSSIGASLLMLIIISIQPNVSWEGHLGGAVGGALVSIPLHYQRFGRSWQRLLGWLGLIAVPVAAVALAYLVHARNRDDFVKERLIASYHRQFRGAEDYLLQRRNRFIVAVMRDADGNWTHDAKFVADFRRACEESLTRLQPLMIQLAANMPVADGVEKDETRNVQHYFEAWHELFQTAERQLQELQRWNPARRRLLKEKDDVLFELRRPLEANTILPRFLDLVPAPEPPPPEAKPPKDVG